MVDVLEQYGCCRLELMSIQWPKKITQRKLTVTNRTGQGCVGKTTCVCVWFSQVWAVNNWIWISSTHYEVWKLIYTLLTLMYEYTLYTLMLKLESIKPLQANLMCVWVYTCVRMRVCARNMILNPFEKMDLTDEQLMPGRETLDIH